VLTIGSLMLFSKEPWTASVSIRGRGPIKLLNLSNSIKRRAVSRAKVEGHMLENTHVLRGTDNGC
jgi:hypothetical protein